MNRKRKYEPRLGIDIGRVIIGPVVGGKADTSFLGGSFERAMQTPPAEGALENIKELTGQFNKRVWLVSKCGKNVQRKTRAWLRYWKFFEETGVPPGNVRFCLERPQKAGHCKQLLITHFVDDRKDVLEHLHGIVDSLYLFGEQKDQHQIPDYMLHVLDWESTSAAVLSDLEAV